MDSLLEMQSSIKVLSKIQQTHHGITGLMKEKKKGSNV